MSFSALPQELVLCVMAYLTPEPAHALALAAACKSGTAALEELTGMTRREFRALHLSRRKIDCAGPYVAVRRGGRQFLCRPNRMRDGRPFLEVSRLGVRRGRAAWVSLGRCAPEGLARVVLTKKPADVAVLAKREGGGFSVAAGRWGLAQAADFHARVAAM